ncbi:hypothetical protein [Sphingomonas kyeonggiensis]|uniref:Uncharacterized protein n=1 Tax=Sphingomonas kyeonggiensis TaxID=1268553 RepID=A0A7W6JTT5_9SPHN|nr:hypothetical protein [Sphingomonas kyeonggiensis]MBB4099447.1 hypothetical protein [Sphingomonas kyeonggiensis]
MLRGLLLAALSNGMPALFLAIALFDRDAQHADARVRVFVDRSFGRPSDDGNLIRIHRLRTLLTGGNFQEIDGKSIVSIFAASPWLEQV